MGESKQHMKAFLIPIVGIIVVCVGMLFAFVVIPRIQQASEVENARRYLTSDDVTDLVMANNNAIDYMSVALKTESISEINSVHMDLKKKLDVFMSIQCPSECAKFSELLQSSVKCTIEGLEILESCQGKAGRKELELVIENSHEGESIMKDLSTEMERLSKKYVE